MSLNRRPNQSPVRWMAALASALLVGALIAPIGVRAQTVPSGPACTAPPAQGNDTWPRAGNDSLGSTAGVPVTFTAATLLANDAGVSLTVRSVGPTSENGGAIAGPVGGPYTYTPAPGFVGPDVFTYKIGNPANETAVGLVTIAVGRDAIAPTVAITAPAGGT